MKTGDRITVRTQDGLVFKGFLRECRFNLGHERVGGPGVALGGPVLASEEVEMAIVLDRDHHTSRKQFPPTLEPRGKKSARKMPTKTKKESTMEKFKATILRNPRTRSVTISLEDKDGKFVTKKGERVERAMGAELPVYMTMPLEIFTAITNASYEDEEY